MKKVLFITYYWPPSGGSGVQRPLKFIKYLRDFGWEPIVYTVENGEFPETDFSLLAEIPENITVLKKSIFEPFAFYKWFTGKKKDFKLVAGYMNQKKTATITEKMAIWIRSNIFIPDARMFWIKPSIHFLDNWLKTNKVDAIITTGPPHSVLLIGLGLKQKHKLPWLVDFRDPWTEIDYYKDLKLANFADKEHKKLEKQVLKFADKVVCVSTYWGSGLARIGNRDIDYISNGYDEQDIHDEIVVNLDTKFSIVHIGMMGKSRNHEVFWQVIAQLCSENEDFKNDIEIKLYGKCDASVAQSIIANKLESIAKIYDYVPHNEIVYIQKSAQVLYLSVNETTNAKGILTGKIYEYLAVKRPILCIAPIDGEAAKVVLDAGAGLVSDFGNAINLKANILYFYNNYKQKISFNGGKDFEKYSRKNQTKKLANLLDIITN